jgi:glutaredoxin-like protein NrdH
MGYQEHVESVPGAEDNDIFLFTLSTCIWCKKTKQMLMDLGVAYDYVDVDLLSGADQDEAYAQMWKYNQSTSFPTIVVNDGKQVILGFDEAEIRGLAREVQENE